MKEKNIDLRFVMEDIDYFPKRGSEQAAGYDLKACFKEDRISINPHETVKVNTGIRLAIPEHYCALILPRSGLATKRGLRPANTPGLIDSDYRGDIIVALHNDSEEVQTIERGERIAQLIAIPYMEINFKPVSQFSDEDETERGTAGFGSTGK